MDALVQFGLTALVTLVVVVDPFGALPIFVGMTRGMTSPQRQATLLQAVVAAWAVALFFLVAGRAVLSYLGVSVQAFGISGGVLLFATALPMLFGQRPGLQAPERAEHTTVGENIAFFPLAIPLLSGPGTLTTILLLTDHAGGDLARYAVLALAVLIVFLFVLLILVAGDRLLTRLGEGKMHILTRVMGILLAALAVQFVLNGITGYYRSLVGP